MDNNIAADIQNTNTMALYLLTYHHRAVQGFCITVLGSKRCSDIEIFRGVYLTRRRSGTVAKHSSECSLLSGRREHHAHSIQSSSAILAPSVGKGGSLCQNDILSGGGKVDGVGLVGHEIRHLLSRGILDRDLLSLVHLHFLAHHDVVGMQRCTAIHAAV